MKYNMVTIQKNIVKKSNDRYHISYLYDHSHYGSNTTALNIYETSQFLILNGNHLKNYEYLKTLKDCLNYFYKNIDKANKYSEHKKIFKIINNKGIYLYGGH